MVSASNAFPRHARKPHPGPAQRLSRKETLTAAIVVAVVTTLAALSVVLHVLHGGQPELINSHWPILP